MLNNVKLINFIDLTYEQKEMILSWRNSENIKEWMYTKHDISMKEHLDFIKSLEGIKNKEYYLLKQGSDFLGVVDFTDIDEDSCYFGFYSNPNSTTPGIGRVLENISLEYAFNVLKVKVLKLEAYEINKRVLNLHKKNKFKKVDTKIINGKTVICMELENENR